MDHLDIKVWVSVSREFRATVIESATNKKCHLSELETLQSRLWLTIQKNCYLLVLDDVWNEDPDEWDILRSILGRRKDGNRIIITTRSKKTASIMGTTSPYLLTGLDDDSCWALNDVDGGVIEYKMHDLIYDLARSITRNEILVLEDAPPPTIFEDNPPPTDLEKTGLEKTRHASLTYGSGVRRILAEPLEAIHLRTLLVLTPYFCAQRHQLLKFPCLRVLDLSATFLPLPEFIDGIVCLRYLDLSYTHSHTLPAAIGNLHFLQTLNLSGCPNLRELPKLRYTVGLRHLNTFGYKNLRSIPEQLGTFVHLQTLPIYIVERSFGRSVTELRNLNLRGALTIKQLENIRSEEEANLANLMKKEHLETLGLCWGNADPFSVLKGSNAYPHLAVASKDNRINEPPHLVEFDADLGTKVLDWLLPNLTEVVLMNCRNCIQLPTLGLLPLLKTLHLQGMYAITSIGPDFYGDNLERNFPSLIELVLIDFPQLNLWLGTAGRDAFSRLRKLVVRNCPNLVLTPALSSLQYLQLYHCNQAVLGSLESLTTLSTLELNNFLELLSLPGELLRKNYCLTSLNISCCSKLSSLPSELEHLTALKSLTIKSCKELSSLPQGLQNLTALVSLEIDGCNSLISLPEVGVGGLSSLRTVSIVNCQNIASLPLGLEKLTSLEHLTIMLCPSLASLPDSFKHLSTFRSLSIFGVDQLEALPEGLQHVTALQSLELHSCPCLVSLPEWLGNYSSLRSLVISDCCSLKALPESFHRLASLRQLTIHGCPDLQEQCEQFIGKDWLKIAHIPYRNISKIHRSVSERVGSSSQ
ncbi:NB-ARC [Dillenia turbinata]|uniref:NB-ARC n=1 Tax=Dillenia turbinata TaxID=194707 RepID=A0AAN8WCP7_9MAGN